jgi:hypothetical protein
MHEYDRLQFAKMQASNDPLVDRIIADIKAIPTFAERQKVGDDLLATFGPGVLNTLIQKFTRYP